MKYIIYLIVLCVYYYLGGDLFPDYQNYMTLLRNDIAGDGEGRALGEWIPRYIMMASYYLGWTIEGSVDVLVIFVQCYFLIWMVVQDFSKNEKTDGVLNYILIMGPLLLTTTLRATPAYLGVAYFISSKNANKIPSLLFFAIGMLSHDSGLIIGLIILLSYYASKIKALINNLNFLIFFGAVFSIIGVEYFTSFQVVLMQFDLGGRSSYFNDESKISIFKNLYWFFIGFVVLLAVRANGKDYRSTFFAISYLIFSVLFVINNVVAIRFALFLLGTIVLLDGGLIYHRPNNLLKRFGNVIFSSVLFSLSFVDILGNTGKVS